MATSSAMSTTNDNIKYKVTITQNSQSVANNTSNVTVSVRVYRTNTGYTTYGTGTIYCTINGTQYTESITSSDKITSSGIVLFTKTLNIAHNADGTKTLATSTRISHDQFSSSSQSYSQALTTIPRATTPTLSASSVNMGANITISMPRASSSFDHTLTYKFGSATGTIGSDLGTSKVWAVPLSLASQIPSATSGTCTITCKTYNGSTLIGTKTVSFTAKVPSSVVPSISALTISEAVAGLATQFGAYVQNKSKLKVAITASGSYSSTIKTYKTTIAGKSYSGSSFTSSAITSSGTITVSTTVTDSRGRTATKSSSVSVTAYTTPSIKTFTGHRCLVDGVENYDGTYLYAVISFAIAPVGNKNTKSYSIEYKLQSETTWTTLTTGSVYSFDSSLISESGFLNVNNSYDVRISVTDFFGTAQKTIEIPTAFTLLDFHSGGKALAFGKVSEKEEGVEFALPTFFSHAETPSSVTYLTEGQDLDDILEPGFYAIATTAISATLLNKPWTNTATGSLIVLREGNGLQKCQIAHKGSKNDGCIYERTYYQGTWGEWAIVHNGGGKILWTGGYYMTAEHKAELSETIASQPSGIVLTFSRLVDGAVQDTNFHHFFIPKTFITEKNGFGHTFILTANKFLTVATKYLYINNTHITGHADNNATGTANGITYNNASFVLRYVIGV